MFKIFAERKANEMHLNKKCIYTITVLIIAALMIGFFIKKSSSLERRIIYAINQSCDAEGNCTIDMTEIANFSWDTVSIFVAGNSPQVMEALGVYPDISDGIVFSRNGEIVMMLTSTYDFTHNNPPKISFYLLEEPQETGLYYKSYSYGEAILYGKKNRQPNGLYKYMVLG